MTAGIDRTEPPRRERLAALNTEAAGRRTLEQRYGRVWDPGELKRDFIVLGFLAPYVAVRRKADRILGSLEFQPHPRLYFNWMEDD
jgi:hypothetical protein